MGQTVWRVFKYSYRSPYPDATAIARAFVNAAPERMVWGSDWPHPTEPADRKPNDACCSICCRSGRPRHRRATAFSSRTLQFFTASRTLVTHRHTILGAGRAFREPGDQCAESVIDDGGGVRSHITRVVAGGSRRHARRIHGSGGSRSSGASPRRLLLAGRNQQGIGSDAVEQGIVPKDWRRTLPTRSTTVMSDADKPGAARPGDYLDFERLLIAVGGPDVTRVHSGRSRQDIKGTVRRLFMREDLLLAFESLIEMRDSLLAAAEAHRDAIIPAYTYGVQAQPTSFGHYMGAMRKRFAAPPIAIVSRGVASTSRRLAARRWAHRAFPINRPRLAELLGFDGNVTNSLDANQIAPLDTGVEVVSIATMSALTIGMLAADITAQYIACEAVAHIFRRRCDRHEQHHAAETESNRPRRSPAAGQHHRGQAMTYTVQSHNVTQGMEDYKMDTPTQVLNASAGCSEPWSAHEGPGVRRSARTRRSQRRVSRRPPNWPTRCSASPTCRFGSATISRPSSSTTVGGITAAGGDPLREARRIYAESARLFQQAGRCRSVRLSFASRSQRRT